MSLAFIGATSTLPDLNLVLHSLGLPVRHHGFTHTILFLVGFAIIAGVLATVVCDGVLKRWWVEKEQSLLSTPEVYPFVTGGLIVGGLSHLFADMLSSPDGGQKLEPFWPVVTEPISFDLVYYSDPKWNLGLLLVAGGLHVGFAAADAGPTVFAAPPGPSG